MRRPGSTAALLVVLVLGPCSDGFAEGEFRVGAAKAAFTLPQSVPLAGYSRRKGRPSRGVHDLVGVRALVVQQGQTTVALVSCDLLIIDEPLFDAVRRRLTTEGLPTDAVLLLAATHTHSGPGAYGRRFLEKISMGHFDPQVFDAIVAVLSDTVMQAARELQPARVAALGTSTEGLVKNRVEERGVTDPELAVVAFYPMGANRPTAVLVNFAAHPTALGAWNMELSGDYPGVLMREVERRLPGTTAFFFAGAVGDQAPVKSGPGFETAEYLGRALAEQTVSLLERATPASSGALKARQERVALPSARVRLSSWLRLPRWLGQPLVDDDATLTILVIGPAVFFGVPCDLSAELGQALKQAARADGREPMVIGFACDYIGYCMPERLYDEKAYETGLMLNGPKTGTLIVERLTRMLRE